MVFHNIAKVATKRRKKHFSPHFRRRSQDPYYSTPKNTLTPKQMKTETLKTNKN